MTVTILIPLLVFVIGVVLHALPVGGATVKKVAEAMILMGLLVTLLALGQTRIRL